MRYSTLTATPKETFIETLIETLFETPIEKPLYIVPLIRNRAPAA